MGRDEPLITIRGTGSLITVDQALRIAISPPSGNPWWRTSANRPPAMSVRRPGGETQLDLAKAASRRLIPFAAAGRRGFAVLLSRFPTCDLTLELRFAAHDTRDELLVEAMQTSGGDTATRIDHLYCLERPIDRGGYLLVPQGSGYLVPAECHDGLDVEGIVGYRWSLPLFAVTDTERSLAVIIDTFWDCSVGIRHLPGERSEIDIAWMPSLGSLSYRRSLLLRWREGTDHLTMAKGYRDYALQQGLLRSLREKERELPSVARFVKGVEFRWPWWRPQEREPVYRDIDRIRAMGFNVDFFMPKPPSREYADGLAPVAYDAGWQSYLNPGAMPGGWGTYADIAREARGRGCVVKVMLNATTNFADQGGYDASRHPQDARGRTPAFPALAIAHGVEVLEAVLHAFDDRGVQIDDLYFDSYSAFDGMDEDHAPLHRTTRRDAVDIQRACFRRTNARGLFCGAELPRFWCIAECSYFMFSDWARDRLTNVPTEASHACVGIPIPLFQLVFHECYTACLSTGGYAANAPGYDWWSDCHPRLHELLFCSQPSHNWMPGGEVPVRDWDSASQRRRWAWIGRLASYQRCTAHEEMVAHAFLDADRRVHRIAFANGVSAELDMGTGLMKVTGVEGFAGDWEEPERIPLPELRPISPRRTAPAR